MKIIGVGFHKTGTTSLGRALKTLGFVTTGWQIETASLYKRGHKEALLDMMADFSGFEDAPWFLMYPEACRRYPDVRLVLTKRKSDDAWFTSLGKHIVRHAPDPFSFRSLIYGQDELEPIREHVIATRRAHEAEVRRFAAENGVPLLEVCWEDGDGWRELCAFVGQPVPNEPFPHANKAPNAQRGILPRFSRAVLRGR